MSQILAALEFVNVDTRNSELRPNEWVLQNGSSVNASCFASCSRTGCATETATRARQPVLPPRQPRVVVLAQKKLTGEGTWVQRKLQFCPVKQCVFALQPPWIRVSRPPRDGTIIVKEDVQVTAELRQRSGGLLFV